MGAKQNLIDYSDRNVCRKTYEEFYESIFEKIAEAPNRQNLKIYSFVLSQLVFFVDDLTSSEEVPFVLRTGRGARLECDYSKLAARYFTSFPDFLEVAQRLSDRYAYCEQVEVFIDACRKLGCFDLALLDLNEWRKPMELQTNSSSDLRRELFNRVCEKIRDSWGKGEYRKRYSQRKADAKKRFKKFAKYPLLVFETCARLVVLRIDLSYKKDITHQHTLEELKNDVEHLLANQRGAKELAFMKGYVVKFEYGVDRGFHAHFLIFMDGSKRKGSSHIHLVKKLGEYWENTITKGRGAYWNCNVEAANYDRLDRRGIGVIHRSEGDLIANLQNHVIAYLCKMDQFIRPRNLDKKVRLILKGQAQNKKRVSNDAKLNNK